MIQRVPKLTSVRVVAPHVVALRGNPWALRIARAACVLGLLATRSVQARDMTGKAGIGVVAATTGTPYLTFRYWRTKVAIEALVSYTSHSAADLNPANAPNVSDLRVAAGLLYRIGDQPRASLGFGVRPWLVYHAETQPQLSQTSGGVDRYGVEFPLQAELFLTDNFSIQGTVAANLQLGSTATRAANQLEAHAGNGSILLTIGGGFSGGLGFSYYF
jgi:hypothetical protein